MDMKSEKLNKKQNPIKKETLTSLYNSLKLKLENNEIVPTDDKKPVEILHLNELLKKERTVLKNISLTDYKRVRDLFVSFEKDLTVFVGDNGYGKSTVLDAVFILLSWLRANIQREDKPGSQIRDIDINSDKKSVYAAISGKFKLEKSITNVLITKVKEGMPQKRNNELKDIKDLAGLYRNVNAFIENSSLPLLVYYSVHRSFEGAGVDNKRNTQKRKTAWNKFDAYEDIISDRHDFDEFLNWFIFINNSATQQYPVSDDNLKVLINQRDKLSEAVRLYTELGTYNSEISNALNKNLSALNDLIEHQSIGVSIDSNAADILRAVKSAIINFLPQIQAVDVFYTNNDVKLLLRKDDILLDAQQLSQGEKTILTLIGDLARRLTLLNPGMSNPLSGSGIVLIDEIDLHLHPQWQQQIVSKLRSTFPNVQFIISTHSPQVLSTVQSRSIRRLEEEYNELDKRNHLVIKRPLFETKGVITSEALYYGMNTDPIPDVKEVRWLDEYKNLIEQQDYQTSKALGLRKKLVSHFGEDHPLIIECDDLISIIDFKKTITSKNKKDF